MKNYFLLFFILAVVSCGEEPKVNNSQKQNAVPMRMASQLSKLLPEKFNDYVALAPPSGIDIQLGDSAFSFTAQKYVSKNDTVYVELHDYLNDRAAFSQYARMWWNSNDEVRNEMKVSKPVSFGPDIRGWMVWERDDNKHSAVYVGIKERYYMVFECFGRENSDFIKGIAASFNYSQL